MEGQAIDYGDKSITKAQSVAYREFLYKTFVVPLESNEDIEQTSHTLVKKEPARALEPIKPYFGKIQFEALSNDVKSGFVNFENVIETKKSIMKEYIVPTEWAEALKMLFEDMTPKNESVIEKVDPVEKVKEDIAKIASKKNQEEVPVEDIDF